MLSFQITLPADPSAPGFFFRTAVEHELAGVLAVRGSAVVPVVPHSEDVGLYLARVNPWVSQPSDRNRVEWPASEWHGFLNEVDRKFDVGGRVVFVNGHLPGDPPHVGYSLMTTMHFDWLPSAAGGWHVLRMALSAGKEDDRRALPAATDPLRLEPLVSRIAERFRPTYAAVSPEELRLNTKWEIRQKVPYPSGGLPASRDYLRGYEWITYCPGRVLDRIGGVDGARASGAFHAVREIGGGLVALQATETPDGYDAGAAERVQEALGEILIPASARQKSAP